jgi:hypothetical protein
VRTPPPVRIRFPVSANEHRRDGDERQGANVRVNKKNVSNRLPDAVKRGRLALTHDCHVVIVWMGDFARFQRANTTSTAHSARYPGAPGGDFASSPLPESSYEHAIAGRVGPSVRTMQEGHLNLCRTTPHPNPRVKP